MEHVCVSLGKRVPNELEKICLRGGAKRRNCTTGLTPEPARPRDVIRVPKAHSSLAINPFFTTHIRQDRVGW